MERVRADSIYDIGFWRAGASVYLFPVLIMKRLIKRLIGFIALILTIGIILNFFLPESKYWGNREYNWKIKQYKKDKYNAVLFGTSRIYRGINPLILDSLINQDINNQLIKSYNLATHASWLNESLYLYDQFLEDTILSGGIKTVFMEYQNVMSINPRKLTDEKIIYYQNASHYKFIMEYSIYEILREPKKIITSLYSIGAFSLVTFVNLTNLKRVSTKIYTKDLQEYESINERGYLGFNELVQGQGTTSTGIRTFTDNIHLYLHKTPVNYNPIYFNKMTELIDKSNKKGIKLIFILPPVRLTEGMMAVFNNLPSSNKIELCDPDTFPQLYKVENWIDPLHLNTRGASYLTVYLSEGINALPKELCASSPEK